MYDSISIHCLGESIWVNPIRGSRIKQKQKQQQQQHCLGKHKFALTCIRRLRRSLAVAIAVVDSILEALELMAYKESIRKERASRIHIQILC